MNKWILIFLVLFAPSLHAHGSFTHDEIEWMERQYSHDGTKCCNELDVHIGQDVVWRINAARTGYEVQINNAWHAVPNGRLRKIIPDDPSPFGYEALLFYSIYPSGLRIWCFTPDVAG